MAMMMNTMMKMNGRQMTAPKAPGKKNPDVPTESSATTANTMIRTMATTTPMIKVCGPRVEDDEYQGRGDG